MTTLLAWVQTAHAQDVTRHPGEYLTVYLSTVGPGDQVWERFGHNMVWIRDANTRTTISYNYGIFQWGPGFVPRFLRGRMLYEMRAFYAEEELEGYKQRNRSVMLQELNLTPAQKDSLRVFLEWNLLDHNKDYLYHYYYDNCSTRVRDALDRAVGGAIRAQLEPRTTGTTYRWHSLRLVGSDFAVYLGLALGLGTPTDRPLNAWDESFIPMQFAQHMSSVMTTGADGSALPLVKAAEVVFLADRPAERAEPPTVWPVLLVAGTVLGGLLVLLSRRACTRRGAAFGLAIALSTWGLLSGFFGLVLALLWLVTDHTTSFGNQNLLQVNPLGLLLAVAAPLAVLRGADARRFFGSRVAWPAALALLALSVAGLLLSLIPGVGQANAPIIALVLPLHIATVLSLYQTHGRGPSSREDVSARMVAAAASLALALPLPLLVTSQWLV